jgi:hypothetical protein
MPGSTLRGSDPLVPLPDLLAELEIPVEGTDLVPGDLGPDRFLELGAMLTILDNAVARTGCEDLGCCWGRGKPPPFSGHWPGWRAPR